MVDFKSLIISFLLVGAFFFSMMTGAILLQEKNNANETLTGCGNSYCRTMNTTFSELNESLFDIQTDAETQKEKTDLDEGETGFGELFLKTIKSAGTSFITMITGIYDLILRPAAQILGISPLIIGVLTTIFLLIGLLAIWKLIKTGT